MGLELTPYLQAARGRSRRAAAGGFTLIEVLMSAALLLIVAIGVLPLFTQAIISNKSGADSTSVVNLARSRLEELSQLDFSNASLTVTAGSETVLDEYYSASDKVWKTGTEPADDSDPALWSRTTTIRQYNSTALDDGALDESEALPAGTAAEQIHFKELVVFVQGGRESGPLGPAKHLTLRKLKAQ